VTTLSLSLDTSTSLTPLNSGCMIDLLKQTRNIQSLTNRRSSLNGRNLLSIEEIHSALIRHTDRSQLRHLAIFICDLNHVQTLLDRFRDLFSIRFLFDTELLTSEHISVFVKTLMPDCSICKHYSIVSVWIGERGTSSICSTSINLVTRRMNEKDQC
jgi:hypothetical protein